MIDQTHRDNPMGSIVYPEKGGCTGDPIRQSAFVCVCKPQGSFYPGKRGHKGVPVREAALLFFSNPRKRGFSPPKKGTQKLQTVFENPPAE